MVVVVGEVAAAARAARDQPRDRSGKKYVPPRRVTSGTRRRVWPKTLWQEKGVCQPPPVVLRIAANTRGHDLRLMMSSLGLAPTR